MVLPGATRHKPWRLWLPHEAKGLSGDGKPALHLRTYRDVLNKGTQGLGKVTVKLVASVETDLFSKEA
jgi:hypothetical protein